MSIELKRKLILGSNGYPEFADYEDKALQDGYIRVRTLFGAPKHGTETTEIQEDPFQSEYYDEQLHLFRERNTPRPSRVLGLGNMWVGRVEETGSGMTGFKVGELAAGYGTLQSDHTLPAANALHVPDEMSWKAAVCFDPLQFALGGIRDSGMRLGDRVLISGQGAIGLMAAQAARAAGALFVAVADPLEKRRKAGLENGADAAYDPLTDDYGFELRDLTEGVGVDVVIETSGSYEALQQGLRALAYNGCMACVGWFKNKHSLLNLGKEGHFNQQRIVFSRACSEPNNDYPRWDFKRIKKAAWEMLEKGMVNCENIVDPVVPFAESAEAYQKYVIEGSSDSVKLGVNFK